MHLAGRSAPVTGASSGIGRETALALSRWGVAVKATARDPRALAEVARAAGGAFLAADLARVEDVDRLADWAGPVDLLVNNAGVGWAGAFSTMEPSRAEELVRVNLLAPIRLAELLLPGMLERGAGHIVNVASIAGHVGVRHEAVYSATKAGLIVFSESLRYEVAGSGVGITVVAPGVVDTAFFERAGRPYVRSFPKLVPAARVARAVVRAVERNRAEVFVPTWMAFPARLRGAMPGLYRSLAARFG